MDGDRQSWYVAVYQAKQQMEAVIAHDQAEQARRKRPKYGK
jgi:hypothetical protein